MNDKLKRAINETITEEQLFSENIGHFNTDAFIESIVPIVKDHIKRFLKKELNGMGLSIIKNTININNVDYTHIINEVSKF